MVGVCSTLGITNLAQNSLTALPPRASVPGLPLRRGLLALYVPPNEAVISVGSPIKSFATFHTFLYFLKLARERIQNQVLDGQGTTA